MVGGVHGKGVCLAKGGGMCGEGGMHGERGACVQERQPLKRAVCILVECILVRLVFLFHQWQGLHLGLRLISNKYIQTFSVNL